LSNQESSRTGRFMKRRSRSMFEQLKLDEFC
jgi:hypothetical protein